MRVLAGMLLLWGVTGCECASTRRAEVEASLGFKLPPGASDFQVEKVATAPLSAHWLVSFTLPATGLEAVVSPRGRWGATRPWSQSAPESRCARWADPTTSRR